MSDNGEHSGSPVRRATMSDVARLAGVSIKTVSRVVNDEPSVHAETAAKVLAAIDRLEFRRNLGARNLRRGSSTGILGLVLGDVANPFYSGLTRAVEEVARASGRHLLTGSSDENPNRERDLALEFCARRVDGLIVVPAGERHGYLVPEMRAGTPAVFVDRPAGDIVADTVLVDNIGGGAAAVAHLVAHGHRRIAFLGDAEEIFTARERLRGFREGCANAGVPFDPTLVAMGPHTQDGITGIVRYLVLGPPGATALVSGNNRITVSVVRAVSDLPYRPALIGFDDFELADLLRPPITVMAHDSAALGGAAAKLLLRRIDGDTSATVRQILPVRLIPRGSAEVPPPAA